MSDTPEGITHTPTSEPEKLSKSELDRITRKMGHRGRTALIAAELTKEDSQNVIAEALEMKSNTGLGKGLSSVPIAGPVLKAIYLAAQKNKAQKAIEETSDLAAAYEALNIKDYKEKSKILNGDTDATNERAWQILENSGYSKDNQIEGATSILNKNEKVEQVDKDVQKTIKEALNDYYLGCKDGKDEAELDRAFDEKVNTTLAEQKDPRLLMETIHNEKIGLEKLASEGKFTDAKVKAYLDQHLTLYRASVKEGINTRKKVDLITAGVINSGLIGGVLAAVTTREAISAARGATSTLGLTGGAAAGAVGGAAMGILTGWQKANRELADAEVKAATTFEDESTTKKESSADAEPDSTSTGEKRKEKENIIIAAVKKYKAFTKGGDLLEELEKYRDRKPASDFIESLDEIMAKLDHSPDNESAKEELREKYAEIVARSHFSNEKNIDLIKYKDKDKNELEKKLGEAERKLFSDKELDLAEGSPTNSIINSYTRRLEENYALAEKKANAFKARMIMVNAVQSAVIGAGIGAVADYLSGTPIAQAVREKAAGILGLSPAADETEAPEVDSGDEIGEDLKEFKGKPVLIENDPDGGVSIGIDKDGDGKIDLDEFIRGKGEKPGIDLTDKGQFEELRDELKEYKIDLQREKIDVSEYGKTSIGEYIDGAESKVDNFNGINWSKSETRVAFGSPTAVVGDGMDKYEVPVWGVNGREIPKGTKLYIDLDNEGPGKPIAFNVENGKAIIPADVLDTSKASSGGAAEFIGRVNTGRMDGDQLISYGTAFGKNADLSTTISAATEEEGFAFTAVDMDTNENLSQFAVGADNTKISNLSEIFNGIAVGDSERLPANFTVNDIDDNTVNITLASGESVSDLDYEGGYNPEFDSYENTAFMESKSYLGTPIHWDLDGDGQMNAAEEASYLRQMLVRTGTNPFMLGQNASNYGLLEPERLEEIIPQSKLVEWGISDGVVNSETDLNLLLDNLKMSENAGYYDRLVNATINEMEKQIDGGGFDVETITDRISTYANKEQFATWQGDIERTIIYPHDADGNPIGNTGWWCRKYGFEGGRVGDMPLCEQKGVETPGSGEEPTGDEPTGEEPTGDEPTGEEPTGDEPTGEEPTGEEPTGDESTGDEVTSKTDNTHAGDETDLPVTPEQGDDYVQPTTDNHVDPNTQPDSQIYDAPADNSAHNQVDHGTASGKDTESNYSTDTSKWKGSSKDNNNPTPPPSKADPGSAGGNNESRSDEELADILKGEDN